jgi:hypothetical protein
MTGVFYFNLAFSLRFSLPCDYKSINFRLFAVVAVYYPLVDLMMQFNTIGDLNPPINGAFFTA